MKFESNMSILYSDTQIPDVFITEYMPSMESDYIKIYIHCLFLCNRNKQAVAEDISKKLELEIDKVRAGLTYLESVGIITRSDGSITMVDLKEKEIRKLYRPKVTSTPEEASLSSERNKKRNRFISSINNAFFQGLMSPTWYTDIDAWFDNYKFEEDVMYSLFQYCYNHKGLAKQYIIKVAESWHNKNIRDQHDLDRYSMDHQKLKDIRSKIMKKIRKQGFLTEYEEAYVEKWVIEFGYDFEIIELALKKTTAILNPNFEYINKILTGWNEKGLKTREEIIEYEKAWKQSNAGKAKTKESLIPQHENYKQREYDSEYFKSIYDNTRKRKSPTEEKIITENKI